MCNFRLKTAGRSSARGLSRCQSHSRRAVRGTDDCQHCVESVCVLQLSQSFKCKEQFAAIRMGIAHTLSPDRKDRLVPPRRQCRFNQQSQLRTMLLRHLEQCIRRRTNVEGDECPCGCEPRGGMTCRRCEHRVQLVDGWLQVWKAARRHRQSPRRPAVDDRPRVERAPASTAAAGAHPIASPRPAGASRGRDTFQILSEYRRQPSRLPLRQDSSMPPQSRTRAVVDGTWRSNLRGASNSKLETPDIKPAARCGRSEQT